VDTVDKAIVNKLLISRHDNTVGDQDFTVFTTASIASTVTSTIASMSLFLGAIAAVSLIVGAVGIANTMFTSVLEKTKEIGTMKAIGAKNKDILMIFLFNSAMVGLVGGILGVILGIFVSSGLQAMMGMTSVGGVSPYLIVEGLFLAIIIGIISGVIPAYRASKLKPVDALRYE
jgi:putative ABC transport system permease protein